MFYLQKRHEPDLSLSDRVPRYTLGNGVDEQSGRFIDSFGLDFYIQCKEKYHEQQLS